MTVAGTELLHPFHPQVSEYVRQIIVLSEAGTQGSAEAVGVARQLWRVMPVLPYAGRGDKQTRMVARQWQSMAGEVRGVIAGRPGAVRQLKQAFGHYRTRQADIALSAARSIHAEAQASYRKQPTSSRFGDVFETGRAVEKVTEERQAVLAGKGFADWSQPVSGQRSLIDHFTAGWHAEAVRVASVDVAASRSLSGPEL